MSSSTLLVGRENSTDVLLHYTDRGAGEPIVLIHGWPLSGASWEKQARALLAAGYRVITYDRRGFGQSGQPAAGYDYDTFAADLRTLVLELELRDATLVGFSMGGGEVARYIGSYGSEYLKRAVFIGAVPPCLAKLDDNPDGVDASVFWDIQKGLAEDRPGFLMGFLKNFYNFDVLGGPNGKISEDAVRANWNVAVAASPEGTIACVGAWGTDFREDLERVDIPALVIHGDQDRIVPAKISGEKTAAAVKGSKLVLVKDAPHGLLWTHAEEVNQALLDFLKST
ncbi:MAG TPA: alpha/beta hydrolase [Candidatus Methylacidiphilales bacterium]